MSRVGKTLIQSPEATDETFGVLCDQFGEVTALREAAPMIVTEPSVPFRLCIMPARS